jgi:hypothetical protein
MHRLWGKAGVLVILIAGMVMSQTPPAKKGASPRRPELAPATDIPPPNAIPRMWPEQLPAQAPRVTYQQGQLAVDSQNSTLSDILTAIRRQTGTQIDIPAGIGNERVAAHLSGSPTNVITSLLDGSGLGFIVLGSPEQPGTVQKVILSVLPKDAGKPAPSTAQARPPEPEPPADDNQPEEPAPPQPAPHGMPPRPGASTQSNPGMNTNPSLGGGEQPGSPPGQPQTPKTPEQILQELQRMRQPNQNPPQQ